MTDVRLIYATAPDLEVARAIGRQLVQERWAACANFWAGMESIYHWDGAVEESKETVLLLKTRTDLVDGLIERLTCLHPYRTPCALAIEVDAGPKQYLDWVAQETRP